MRHRFTERKKRTIGICGLGSVRVSIALANYYCSYLKKKVLIGEVGSGGMSDISTESYMGRKPSSFTRNGLVGFTKMRVDYFPNLSIEESIKLSREDVDIIILVFTKISHDYTELYRLCDRRLLLCNISIYNRRLFCQTRNLFENDTVEVEVYCWFLLKKDKEWYENVYKDSKYSNTVKEIPIIRDPDRLTRQDISLLKEIGC